MDYPHSYRLVDDALISRRSIRKFLSTPVDRAVVEDILHVARRAPSGTNIQPWQVYVLAGEPLNALSSRILEVFNDPVLNEQHQREYLYYPDKWFSPFIERRRAVGFALYDLLGIAKGEHGRMHDQHARNFKFFDAPVGMMFTIHRDLAQGSWLDYGMFIQNVMIAARARGLDTCPQVSFAPYHRIVADAVAMPAHEMLVCGMSLGYADPAAPENSLVTDREPVERFTQFFGF